MVLHHSPLALPAGGLLRRRRDDTEEARRQIRIPEGDSSAFVRWRWRTRRPPPLCRRPGAERSAPQQRRSSRACTESAPCLRRAERGRWWIDGKYHHMRGAQQGSAAPQPSTTPTDGTFLQVPLLQGVQVPGLFQVHEPVHVPRSPASATGAAAEEHWADAEELAGLRPAA